jgi:hypothetical protein
MKCSESAFGEGRRHLCGIYAKANVWAVTAASPAKRCSKAKENVSRVNFDDDNQIEFGSIEPWPQKTLETLDASSAVQHSGEADEASKGKTGRRQLFRAAVSMPQHV